MPPRHGKSQLASIYFPAWFLGRNPEQEIITTSYSGELAKKFGGDTRDIISDAQYQAIFDIQLKEDSQAKNLWKTQQGGSYTAVGRGGTITGRGADVLLIDDPIANREEAESKTIRDSVWDWYTSTVYTRLEKGGAIIIIMTRWHTDDLVGRVLEKTKETGEQWTVISFPAIAERDEKFRKQGEPLWPEKKDLNDLALIKQLNPYDWHALWQQNPISVENQEFKPEYFTYFEEKDLPKPFDIDITIDPAISKKKDACNSARVAVGKQTKLPDWYVLDYKFGKFDPLQLIDATFALYNDLRRQYSFANIKVHIEGVAYQESLKYFFQEEMRRRQQYFNLETFVDKQDKEQRIRGLVPLYKTGVIHHRKWMTDIEDEALTFPRGKTVDIIDALSFQLHIKANTEQEKEPYIQPDWEDFYQNIGG